MMIFLMIMTVTTIIGVAVKDLMIILRFFPKSRQSHKFQDNPSWGIQILSPKFNEIFFTRLEKFETD